MGREREREREREEKGEGERKRRREWKLSTDRSPIIENFCGPS